jgi:hypothetical protein
MSDSNNNNNDSNQKEINEKISLKLVKIKDAKKLTNNSRWSPAQEIMQEIIATHTVANPNKIPSVKSLLVQLIEEINKRYEDDEETRDIILGSVPTAPAVHKWLNNKDFDAAVWEKIRSSGLFTKERRADMINALYTRGIQRDTQAAKVWLQLSGDLKEDPISRDKTVETFREINQILHKKDSK